MEMKGMAKKKSKETSDNWKEKDKKGKEISNRREVR